MAPWVAVIEALLVKRLLQSPAFHSAVRKVHKNVHKLRHGTSPEEMGGTKLDRPGGGFLTHFVEEIQGQIGRKPGKTKSNIASQIQNGKLEQSRSGQNKTQNVHGTELPPTQPGYLSYLLGELKDQMRGGRNNGR